MEETSAFEEMVYRMASVRSRLSFEVLEQRIRNVHISILDPARQAKIDVDKTNQERIHLILEQELEPIVETSDGLCYRDVQIIEGILRFNYSLAKPKSLELLPDEDLSLKASELLMQEYPITF